MPINRSFDVLKTWATSSPSSCGSSSTSSVSSGAVWPWRWSSKGVSEMSVKSDERLADADVLAGREADDGDHGPADDRAVGGGPELIGRDRLAVEVALHQPLVGLDDLLDDHLVRLGRSHRACAGRLGRRVEDVDDAGEGRALADRDEEGDAAGAEALADAVEQADEVDVVGVHLGQGDQPAELEADGLLEDAPGVDLDARWGRDRQDEVLDGGEGAEGVADEVGVAGAVDQVDLLVLPLAVEQVAVDGEMPAFLLVLDVGDARAVVHAAAAIRRRPRRRAGRRPAWSCPTPRDRPGQCSGCRRCDRLWLMRLSPLRMVRAAGNRTDFSGGPWHHGEMGAGRRGPPYGVGGRSPALPAPRSIGSARHKGPARRCMPRSAGSPDVPDPRETRRRPRRSPAS